MVEVSQPELLRLTEEFFKALLHNITSIIQLIHIVAIVACSQAKAKAHNVCRIVEVVCGEDQIPPNFLCWQVVG